MHVRPIIGFAAGLAIALFGLSPDSLQQDRHTNLAAAGRIAAPPYANQDLTQAMTALESALAAPQDEGRWASNAKMSVWNFTRQIQARSLSKEQEATVLKQLTVLQRRYPAGAPAFGQARRTVSKFTVGKVAPEIVGRDLEGRPIKLSDYRGRVVVLAFTGNWCGICRSDYPFDRQLLERYGASGFAFIGVNSDTDPAAAKKAYDENGLSFRAFWDGAKGGPIATAWEVTGWPTVYVLDALGVIRFVDLRQQSLIDGVGELLAEPQDGR